jgi:hypothetical protein
MGFIMKKILSLFLASASVLACFVFGAAASSDIPSDAATYCFDNDGRLSDWELYGSVSQAGFAMSISKEVKESGNGSLALTQTLHNPVTTDKYGGAYISADKLGLENFSGCAMRVSYQYGSNPDNIESFSIFSDGIVWIQVNAPPPSGGKGWATAEVYVPENAANTRFGFTIPTFNPYNGVTMHIDNIFIYDREGNAVANLGDFQIEEGTSLWETDNLATTILLIALLVAAVAAIVFGIILAVKTYQKKKLM